MLVAAAASNSSPARSGVITVIRRPVAALLDTQAVAEQADEVAQRRLHRAAGRRAVRDPTTGTTGELPRAELTSAAAATIAMTAAAAEQRDEQAAARPS